MHLMIGKGEQTNSFDKTSLMISSPMNNTNKLKTISVLEEVVTTINTMTVHCTKISDNNESAYYSKIANSVSCKRYGSVITLSLCYFLLVV